MKLFLNYPIFLYSVYSVPNLHGHDIKLDSLKTSVVFKFMIILQNLITTNPREGSKNKYDRKLLGHDVMTMRYYVNRAKVTGAKHA